MTEISPPQNVEAERALLGAVLMAPYVWSEVETAISAGDFAIHRHRWIWDACASVVKAGIDVDLITIKNALEKSGHLEEVGGATYLSQLINDCPFSPNARAYAEIVRVEAVKRAAINSLSEIAKGIYSANGNLADVLGQAATQFGELKAGYAGGPTLAGAAGQVYAEQARTLADALAPRPPQVYIVSPILAARSLNIFFAAEARLKSLVLADLAMACASGAPGWLPNMPGQGSGAGYPVTQCPVLWVDLDNGEDLTAERLAAFARGYNAPPDIPLFWLTFPSPPLIAAKGLPGLATYAKSIGAGLIVIDNLLRVAGVRDENASEMDAAMGYLRLLAEDTGAAVVVIHHETKDTNREDRLRIRGHSSIAAAPDSIFLITRKEGEDAITVKQTKHRRKLIEPFSALWTYELAGDGQTLHTARFYLAEVVDPKAQAMDELKAHLLMILADGPQSAREINALAEARGESVRAALGELRLARQIKCEMDGQKKVYTLCPL